MNGDFHFSFFIRVILIWTFLMLLLRFLILDYEWSPSILILPIWIFIMIVGGISEFKFKNYIQDKYFNGEYIYKTENIFKRTITYKVLNLSVKKEINEREKLIIIRWNQNNMDDKVIQKYLTCRRIFRKVVFISMLITPFIIFLTTIKWDL